MNKNVSRTFFEKCSYLHEKCGKSWNEWKINFPIFAIFRFWVMVDFVLKNHGKIDQKMCISQKLKIGKIGKLKLHLFQHIPYLSCKFEHFWNFEKKLFMNYWLKEILLLFLPRNYVKLSFEKLRSNTSNNCNIFYCASWRVNWRVWCVALPAKSLLSPTFPPVHPSSIHPSPTYPHPPTLLYFLEYISLLFRNSWLLKIYLYILKF